MFFVIVAAFFAGLTPALAPKPEFNGSLHAKQLAFVAIATVLANPIAQAAQAFTAPGRKDIKNDSGIAARSKRAGRELAQLKSWISPYVALWKAVRSPSTREATKGQMILAAIKQHKTFSACALILGVDVAVVTGLLLKHLYADLPAWEKLSAEEKAQARRELEDKIKKLKKEMGEADADADLSSFEQEKLDAELVRLAEKLIKVKERSDLEEKIKALRAELKETESDLAGLDLLKLQAELARLEALKVDPDKSRIATLQKLAQAAAEEKTRRDMERNALSEEIQALVAELKSDVFVVIGKETKELKAKLAELKQIKADRDDAKVRSIAARKAKQEEDKKRAKDAAEQQRLALLPQVQKLQTELRALFAGVTVPGVVDEDIRALDLPKLQKKQAALLKIKTQRTEYLERVKEKAEAEAAREARKAAKAQREQQEREAAAKAEREKQQAEAAQRRRADERDTLKKGMTDTAFPKDLATALSGTGIPLLAISSGERISEDSGLLPKPGVDKEFNFALAKGRYFWRPTVDSLWVELVGSDKEAKSAHKAMSLASQGHKFVKTNR